MFEALESGIGLDIILWFQNNRTPWMEDLSILLSELGNDLGYVVIFGIIYWLINKRHGLRLVFALVMVAIVTFALKDFLGRPRPFEAYPDLITPVFEAVGNGVPSGHTAFAVMIWGYIAVWVRKGWMWAFAIFYMILQGLGRMVAGVHFPQDIVLGAIVGVVTLALYYPLARYWCAFWDEQSTTVQVMLAIIIPSILCGIAIFSPIGVEDTEAYLTMLGLAIGGGLGTIAEPKMVNFQPPEGIAKQIAIFVVGAILTVAVLLGLSAIFDLIAETGVLTYGLRVVRYAVTAFTTIIIVPYLGVQIGWMQRESASEPVPAT